MKSTCRLHNSIKPAGLVRRNGSTVDPWWIHVHVIYNLSGSTCTWIHSGSTWVHNGSTMNPRGLVDLRFQEELIKGLHFNLVAGFLIAVADL